MEENPGVSRTHRASPLGMAGTAWALLGMGFTYLFLPRDGVAYGPWDAAGQLITIFLLFAVIPFVAIHGIDMYRAHVAQSPEQERVHRLGLALLLGAGVFSVGSYVLLAFLVTPAT